MTISETDVHQWPNNALTVAQLDPDGDSQSLIFMDGDYNVVIGPDNKPTLFTYIKSPNDWFRLKAAHDFHEPGMPSMFSRTLTSTGGFNSGAAPEPSCLELHTGTTLGGGVKMWMPNVWTQMPNDARLYFYLKVTTALNLDLQFGFMNLNTFERAMFRRYESTTASNWQAYTQNAAGNATTTMSSFGSDTNAFHTGLIWLTKDANGTAQIKYFMSDVSTGGNMPSSAQPFATHTTNLPSSTAPLVPFLSFNSAFTGGTNKTLLIDGICLSATR